jgi:ferredoxin/flavodoxin---NADP+ reductase
MFTITRKQSFNEDTFLLEFRLPAVAERAMPGQYVDIHMNLDGDTFTLPIATVDREAGTFAVVEQARDLPTERLMMLAQGEEVFQIRGPLGAPCRVDSDGKVVLVAEELGVASLLWRARAFKDHGAHVIVVLGFASKDRIFWKDEFAAVADELYIATEDGSFGISGRVTGVLQALCETHKDIDRIGLIARLKHMKRGAKIANDFGIDATVSFAAIRFPVGAPTIFDQADNAQEAFAFARAPDLDADSVDFEKLLTRERALSKDTPDEPEPAPLRRITPLPRPSQSP